MSRPSSLTPEQAHEQRLLEAALALATEPERGAFLATIGDPALRQRLAALVASSAEADSFFKEPPLPAEGATKDALHAEVMALLKAHEAAGEFMADDAPLSPEIEAELARLKPEEAGERIGSYKLLEQIGEGGFGTVWMAEQEKPVRRRVALKIIKVGMDTKQVMARFEQERQALAMMDHPNIAKVFDAGATPFGRPFFVMELVRGIPITEYCDEARLTMKQRLELFVRVCQAVQHAHQKGIIHRDIKPTNVLVTLHDGVPVPKVIDFGVAKATQQRLTEMTLFTGFEQMIGTPLYMSPEQAEMSGLDVDTRSDIYALGILLYELLTGRTPLDAEEFKKHGYDEMRRVIREEEPARPSIALRTMPEATRTKVAHFRESESPKLVEALEGDLDWIVMKALEKDRTRRYETANGLGTDIQRHLDNEPVLARPPTRRYRLQKLYRRHQGVFAAAAIVAATLIVGLGISIWQAVRARDAEKRALGLQNQEMLSRQRAEREGTAARLNEYVADIGLAAQSLKDGNYRRGVSLLEKHRPEPGEADLRGFEWRYLWQLAKGESHFALPAQDGPVQSIAFSPDGKTVVFGLQEKLNVWSVQAKSLSTVLPGSAGLSPSADARPAVSRSSIFGPRGITSSAFLPDGKTLVTAGPSSVRLWSTEDWTEQRLLPESAGPVVLSPDGSLLAVLQRRRGPAADIAIWETKTWTQVRVFPGATSPVAFSPDGATFAATTDSGIVLTSLVGDHAEIVLQGSSNRELRGGPVFLTEQTLTFSPDGKFVVSARNAWSERGVFVLSIWDAKSGADVGTMPGSARQIEHSGVISAIAFSPDGRTLATASLDHSIRLWDFEKLEPIATLHDFAEVWALAFSPDGQTLASGAKDGSVKLWALGKLKEEDIFREASSPLAFSKDGGTLVALTGDDSVSFFNTTTGDLEKRFSLESEGSGRMQRFPVGSQQRAPTNRPGRWMQVIAGSSDLRTLVQGQPDGSVRIASIDGSEPRLLKVSNRPLELLALSPDGRVLITGSRGEQPRWWNLPAETSEPWPVEALRVQFSPDGRTAAAFVRDDAVQLWDVATRTLRVTLEGESALGNSAAFSMDGKLFASAWQNDTIRLWDAFTGALLGTFAGHKQPVFSVAFSPDGRTLASVSDDSTLRLWNVATQQELLVDQRLGEPFSSVLFSPDGRLLIAGGGGRAPHVYRAPLLSETEPDHRRN